MPRRPADSPLRDDYDSPWKEALEHFLPQAVAVFAPELHGCIDWTRPPVFLDKEFQDIASAIGGSRRQVDKLVRLELESGRYLWLLLHVEVESRRLTAAALRRATLRVQQYDYRIHDRYVLRPALLGEGRAPKSAPDIAQGTAPDIVPTTVYTLIIFTRGDGPDWLTAYHRFLQNPHPLRYQAVYLERWLARWQALEELARSNPFAVVIMAQLLAQRHRQPERLQPKLGLVRLLRTHGYARADVVSLAKLVDCILMLPAELHEPYTHAVGQIKKESRMAYVSTQERVYLRLTLSRLLQDQAEQKFGSLPDWARLRLQQAHTPKLRVLSRRILKAESLQALFE